MYLVHAAAACYMHTTSRYSVAIIPVPNATTLRGDETVLLLCTPSFLLGNATPEVGGWLCGADRVAGAGYQSCVLPYTHARSHMHRHAMRLEAEADSVVGVEWESVLPYMMGCTQEACATS